jgi:hypothetical protein
MWAAGALMLVTESPAPAQNATTAPISPSEQSTEKRIDELSQEVAELKSLVLQLQDQLRRASAQPAGTLAAPAVGVAPPVATAPSVAAPPVAAAPPIASSPAQRQSAGLLDGASFGVMVDGYYEWNANSPIGRANYLRAYDISSNSFSLNQADLVLESAPDLATGKRYGVRLDLQFGQATSTLQGNPVNELRPEVYRNIFQAYGTYIFPVAAGLTVDFGKWASSLGLEGNYTKDQLNYSRSFLFDFLPFYHTGVR